MWAGKSSLTIINDQYVGSPKGDQSWVFIGRTDVEAETAMLWPPDAKSWVVGKDSDAGKDRGQEEKGTTEDETVGWHHWLDGHGFGWTPGSGDGQGGLACCGSWSRKELDTTERLNWTELNWMFRTPSPGDSISVALRKPLQRGRRGSQAIDEFATKGAGSLNIKMRYQVRECGILWMGRCNPLGSLNYNSFQTYLHYLGLILFPCSPCFFCSPISSAITAEGGGIHRITVWGALIHIWRPEITDGYDISCLWIWQEIFPQAKNPSTTKWQVMLALNP